LRTTAYQAFIFQHTINMEEYLKENYNLDFKMVGTKRMCMQDPDLQLGTGGDYENTWIRSNIDITESSLTGIKSAHGNVLTWEALENGCSLTEAITHVKLKSQNLGLYKSIYLIRLERFAKLVTDRMTMGRASQVTDYLESRGIDYLLLDKDFAIGSPGTFENLVNFFSSTPFSKEQIRSILLDLFIARRSGDPKYLPFRSSVIVPVYSQRMDFLGFHGRYVTDSYKRKYFNTGWLRQDVKSTLFGEEKEAIQEAIKRKKQLILTKGIFDFFACYQNGFHQVMATLNQGISSEQFDRVIKFPVSAIVVGFTAARERDAILSLMQQSLNKIDLSLIDDTQDIDTAAYEGVNLSDLISGAVHNMQASEEGIRAAKLKKKKKAKDALTELGQTFLVRTADLGNLIKTSKKSPRKIKKFLFEESKIGRSDNSEGGYIRFPKTFVTAPILEGFGAELRTLLHLLIKTKDGQRPINYTQSSLRVNLDLSQAVLITHLKELKQLGYLMWKSDIRIEVLKTKRKRTVVFHYYPSTIKYG
jgi:hypothetical protein